MRKPSVVCGLFSAALIFWAGCGDDDKATGPKANASLDDRLLGTWALEIEDEGELKFVFEKDGTLRVGSPGVAEFVGSWSAADNRLTLTVPAGSYDFAISGGDLEFTTSFPGASDLGDYSFSTDGSPSGLTGVTWVDDDGDELVFNDDGTYVWGEVDDPFEMGNWTVEGSRLTITQSETSRYAVNGNTLTLTDEDGEQQVLTKQ